MLQEPGTASSIELSEMNLHPLIQTCFEPDLPTDHKVALLCGASEEVSRGVSAPADLPPATSAVVSALRRLHGLPAILPMDPGLYAVWSLQAGTPLMLCRLAVEEARLLDAESPEPWQLGEMSRLLLDPGLEHELGSDAKSLEAVRTLVEIYRAIHMAAIQSRAEESRDRLDDICRRPLVRDPLTIAALAELRARVHSSHPDPSSLIQPLILATAMLQDDRRYQPRLVELGAFRYSQHVAREEKQLATRTLAWLQRQIQEVNWTAMPELAEWRLGLMCSVPYVAPSATAANTNSFKNPHALTSVPILE